MNKFRAKKTTLDGIKFDSKLEAEYYTHLKLLEKAGKISNLQRQVPFELLPAYTDSTGKKIRPIKYKADFVFNRGEEKIIVDVKGVQTREFKLKWKLLGYKYPQYKLEIVTNGDF